MKLGRSSNRTRSTSTLWVSVLVGVALLGASCGGSDGEADSTDVSPTSESASPTSGDTDSADTADTPDTTDGSDTSDTTGDSTAGDTTEAPADLEPVDGLNVSVGSAFVNYGAWWIADGAGLFEKHGVDVNVITYAGAPTAMASLAAGQIDVMANSVGLGMTGRAQGQDVQFIYGLSNLDYRGVSIIGSTEIETLEQLAEKSPDCVLSVTVPGSAPLGYINQVAETFGLECERVVGNTMESVLNLVATGQADAGVVFPQQAQVAADAGQVNILYDAFTATPEEGAETIKYSFLFGGMITSADVIEDKRESLVRMLRALDEANQMIADLPAEELAEITKQVEEPWLATPVETLAQMWELGKGFVVDGEITPDEWTAALDGYQVYIESAVINVDDPNQQFDVAVDMSLLTEARE